VTKPSDGDRIIYYLRSSTGMKILFHDECFLKDDSSCFDVFLLSVSMPAFYGKKM